ncbi:unnamed protein product [Lepeophtheirus salmonis]|uniref:(salmon louse) hypothetical protein n=3 Tax=Lepeophtheirus salmonis TaxID=72036 RepID=A0A7R8CCA2_LEPSM|nr:unnamed protein product [Lepeophtheirus salmonis]CAF2763995.1 unnamed protein product [Lepeophtheirus salmonis]
MKLDSLSFNATFCFEDFGLEFVVPEYTFPQGLKGTLKLGCSTTDKCPIGVVEFRLISKIRQIDLFTEKTHYKRGEKVNFFYGGINEEIHMVYSTIFHIWILDPHAFKEYEWRGLTLEDENFGNIEYPLGLKASYGNWKICAREEGEVDYWDHSEDCVGFTVQEEMERGHHRESVLSSEKHYVDLFFGDDMKRTYLSEFPFTGRVMVDSTEDEVEISVRLMEVSQNETKVLDSETLLLRDEAIFEFMDVNSTCDKLILEAELISLGTDNRTSPLLNAVLASEVIQRIQTGKEPCSIRIGEGLDRTFKPGDATTIDVLASCPCDVLGELHWYSSTRDQIIAWGKHLEKAPYQNGRCLHKISLPLVSRMAPKSNLQVWTHYVDRGNDDVLLVDSKNFSLTLKDTSLLILETNTTEICVFGSSGKEEDNYEEPFNYIRSFHPGKLFWFFHCSQASEDGFYTASVLPPDPKHESTLWTLSSVSISPEHGIRRSHNRFINRKKTLEVDLLLPTSIRASESFMVDLQIRSDMPLNLQVTVIFSISTEKKISVSPSAAGGYPVEKTISAHVNAIAVIGEEDVEIESLYVTKKIVITPQGNTLIKRSLQYFCANEETLQASKQLENWRIRSLSTLKNKEILFTVKDSREVRLALTASDDKFEEDTEHQDDSNAFQVVIEYQLLTKKTPGIISPIRYKTFSISWKDGTLTLRVFDPSNHTFNYIISWPIQAFKPNFIGVKSIPGHEEMDIRFWIDNDESGYNQVFPLEKYQKCVSNSQNIEFLISKGLVLPTLSTYREPRVEINSLEKVIDSLRDSATIFKSIGGSKDVMNAFHMSVQELLYYKNVEESFSPDFVSKSFNNALELLYLLNDVKGFFHIELSLIQDLEEWIINYILSKSKQLDLNTVMSIVEWSCSGSKIIMNFEEDILHLLENEYLSLNKSSPRLTFSLLQINSKHKEDAMNELYLKENIDEELGDQLVYLLLCLTHEKQDMNMNKRPKLKIKVFERIQQRIDYLLAKNAYLLNRALFSYVYHQSFFPYDLKISVATSDLTTTSTLIVKNVDEPPSNNHNVSLSPSYKRVFFSNNNKENVLPTKLYLLATGYGCGSMQMSYTCSKTLNESVYTKEETENRDYKLSLAMKEEADYLFLNVCIRLTKQRKDHITLDIKMFSGYDFESIQGIGKPNARWKVDKLQYTTLLHLSDVSVDCGSCFRLKFKRSFMVEILQPSIISIFWRYSKIPSSKIFFHISSKNSSLLNGLTESNLKHWFGSNQYNRGEQRGVITSFDNQPICPCAMQCNMVISDIGTSELNESSKKMTRQTTTTMAIESFQKINKTTVVTDGGNSAIITPTATLSPPTSPIKR